MTLEVRIFGLGCANCRRLYASVKSAIAEFDSPVTLTTVEDIYEIAQHKIFALPALVIDGELKAAGRVPDSAEIVAWLATAASREVRTNSHA